MTLENGFPPFYPERPSSVMYEPNQVVLGYVAAAVFIGLLLILPGVRGKDVSCVNLNSSYRPTERVYVTKDMFTESVLKLGATPNFMAVTSLSEILKAMLKKIKSPSYSRYHAETCNEWRGPSPRLCLGNTSSNSEETSQRWRAIDDTVSKLTGPGIDHKSSVAATTPAGHYICNN